MNPIWKTWLRMSLGNPLLLLWMWGKAKHAEENPRLVEYSPTRDGAA